MKKSLLLIKALIIVVWSAQVYSAEFVFRDLTHDILSSGKLLFSDTDESIFVYRNNYYKCSFVNFPDKDVGFWCVKLTTTYIE